MKSRPYRITQASIAKKLQELLLSTEITELKIRLPTSKVSKS